MTRSAFSQRLRFPRLRFKDVVLGLGVYLFGLIGLILLTQVGHGLIASSLMLLP